MLILVKSPINKYLPAGDRARRRTPRGGLAGAVGTTKSSSLVSLSMGVTRFSESGENDSFSYMVCIVPPNADPIGEGRRKGLSLNNYFRIFRIPLLTPMKRGVFWLLEIGFFGVWFWRLFFAFCVNKKSFLYELNFILKFILI